MVTSEARFKPLMKLLFRFNPAGRTQYARAYANVWYYLRSSRILYSQQSG